MRIEISLPSPHHRISPHHASAGVGNHRIQPRWQIRNNGIFGYSSSPTAALDGNFKCACIFGCSMLMASAWQGLCLLANAVEKLHSNIKDKKKRICFVYCLFVDIPSLKLPDSGVAVWFVKGFLQQANILSPMSSVAYRSIRFTCHFHYCYVPPSVVG